MRVSVTVGELDTKDIVSLRKCEDGSINIIVQNRLYKATFQRTQNGNFLLNSTYPKDLYVRMIDSLSSIETEIERRCIEISESELRIDYKPVLIDEGQRISVGQSNSMTIYILVEGYEHRALFHYDGQKVRYVRSSYPPEDGSKISKIISRDFPKILAVMEESGMIQPRQGKSSKTNSRLYQESFSSCMTESGKEERQKVDKVIEGLFKELDSKEYSNLEIQSMLMESVFEVALQYRVKTNRSFASLRNN